MEACRVIITIVVIVCYCVVVVVVVGGGDCVAVGVHEDAAGHRDDCRMILQLLHIGWSVCSECGWLLPLSVCCC